MDLHKLARVFAPVAAVALATTLSACGTSSVEINGDKGKPLSELDLSGLPPHAVALFGPDTVALTTGDKLAISVDGDPAEAAELRFNLKDGTLGILRRHGWWGNSAHPVTVHVTMPPPGEIVMTGSGATTAEALADNASVTIAGSGTIATPRIATSKLEVSIAGTGSYRAGGHAGSLELNIAGTGNADLAGLKVDSADVSIAGTGNSSFASDGTVSASIMGSGVVTVTGRAKCKVSALGSGKLVCEPGDGKGTQTASDSDDDSADDKADSADSDKDD